MKHRRFLLSGALAALTAIGAAPGCSRSENASPKQPGVLGDISRALAPRAAFAKSAAPAALPDIAERVVKSVVNISSKKLVESRGGPPGFGPFQSDPFFRFFRPNGGQRHSRPRHQSSLGSGVLVSADGVVLTNNHVVEDADEIKVSLADGREFEADVVGTDPDSDLGVLRLKNAPKDLLPLGFGDSSKLRLGEVVLAVGNPFGVGQTVTMGIVSAKGRTSVGMVEYEDFIQTDAAINPGNSGGALVDLNGNLVGINTAIISRSGGYQGIGFAIPSNMAQPIMKSLLSDGKVVRGFLGVMIQDVTPALKEAMDLSTDHGVLLSEIQPNTPAERAGLMRGDVIVKANGTPVRDASHFRNRVAAAGANETLSLEVLRKGRTQKVEVTLGEKPGRNAVAHAPSQSEGLGGAQVAELSPPLRERFELNPDARGVLVTRVERDTPAARAGLRPGDLIVEVDRRAVGSPEQVQTAYRRAGSKVLLLIKRRNRTLYTVLGK